ncbi:MAG: restriction endonuclease subunit S [Bacteroidota bacterium]
MNEWKEIQLRDISSDISYGYTASAASENVGPKFLRITDITSGRINWETVPYCKISDKDLQKYQLGVGDIVIARTGATTGYNAIIKKEANAVFASYLIRFQIDKKIADPFFVGHILQSNSFQDYVDAIAGGSAQPGANAQQLADFVFSLPPLPEQKSIAETLSSLDDKIDLLHRQNKTLEQLAETLFRQWFVEEAVESWEKRSLSSIADFLNGLACQKFPPQNETDKLPVLKIKDLGSGITESSDWASTDIKPEYIIKNGDVIFAWSASLMVKIWSGDNCILNQHLFKVTSNKYPKWFYYLWCTHHLAEFISISASHATTMGHIKRGDLDEATVLVPSDVELKKMTDSMDPLFDKMLINNKQIRTLTQLRDTLLPKLMSGEVRVEMN